MLKLSGFAAVTCDNPDHNRMHRQSVSFHLPELTDGTTMNTAALDALDANGWKIDSAGLYHCPECAKGLPVNRNPPPLETPKKSA